MPKEEDSLLEEGNLVRLKSETTDNVHKAFSSNILRKTVVANSKNKIILRQRFSIKRRRKRRTFLFIWGKLQFLYSNVILHAVQVLSREMLADQFYQCLPNQASERYQLDQTWLF